MKKLVTAFLLLLNIAAFAQTKKDLIVSITETASGFDFAFKYHLVNASVYVDRVLYTTSTNTAGVFADIISIHLDRCRMGTLCYCVDLAGTVHEVEVKEWLNYPNPEPVFNYDTTQITNKTEISACKTNNKKK